MKKLLAAAALVSAFSAQAFASTGEVRLGSYYGSGSFSSALDYRTAVETAVAGSAANAVSSFDNLTITSGQSNYAIRTTISFGVTDANAGLWNFRAGVDFGKGGAIFVDGQALAVQSGNMWWAGSYANPSQSFQVAQTLASGNHTLTLYGLEDCCSGNQQIQFSTPGATSFASFGATDGLNAVAAVPEPETYAMLASGLAVIGAIARRRKAAQQA